MMRYRNTNMAAIFYKYTNKGLFKLNQGTSTAAPARISVFPNTATSNNLTLITGISIRTNEIIQTFTTFDDAIHYFHFGKGVGSMVISGVVFMDCSGNMPGLALIYGVTSKIRGVPIVVSTGNYTFTGIINDISMNIVSEPDTMAEFTLQLIMTENDAQPTITPTSNVTC